MFGWHDAYLFFPGKPNTLAAASPACLSWRGTAVVEKTMQTLFTLLRTSILAKPVLTARYLRSGMWLPALAILAQPVTGPPVVSCLKRRLWYLDHADSRNYGISDFIFR
jgi:hypothetical protein